MEYLSDESNAKLLIEMFEEANTSSISIPEKSSLCRNIIEGLIKHLNGLPLGYTLFDHKMQYFDSLIDDLKEHPNTISYTTRADLKALRQYFLEMSHSDHQKNNSQYFDNQFLKLKRILEGVLSVRINFPVKGFDPKEYLSKDLRAINKMEMNNPIQKDEFYLLLACWYENNRLNGSEKINKFLPTGNTPCVWIKDKGRLFKLNADTKISGVKTFLEYGVKEWEVVENKLGRKNKVVVTPNKRSISGFYLYLNI